MGLALRHNEPEEREFELLEKLGFLIFQSARWKVVHGGRGAGKTEGFAEALIILARSRRLRILCLREFQNSIAESVHATIKQKIYDLRLEDEFKISDSGIEHKFTGSEFLFKGLRYNIDAIKSLARIDIAWLEEARNTSKTSLEKLGPTIRGRHEDDPAGLGGPFGKGPEIWISFNPELDTDEVYKRFIKQKDKYAPDWFTNEKGQQERYAIVVKLNHSDNRWFPPDLKMEMEIAKANDNDAYMHVWEGNTKQVLEGAIYANEIKKVLLEQRRGLVRYNPSKPVFTFWDLGHSDKTAIWFVQHAGVEFNLIRYYENRLQKMPFYIKQLQDFGYNYGRMVLPHDGDDETLSNVTPKKQLIDVGFKVIIVKRPSRKVVGINAARSVFDLCNFDEENTADGWQCLCNYAYKVNLENNQFSKEPDHDTPWSHGADGFQTFGLSLKPEAEMTKPRTVTSGTVIKLRGDTGWMR